MTTPAGRTPLDHLTSDELDQLYDERDRLAARLADTSSDRDRSKWYRDDAERRVRIQRKRAERAEAALARIAALAEEHPAGIDTALIHAALDQTTLAATDADTTTRVFAALHHSAEQDVTRVIDLYERWVKAGPPPLGVSLSRWWDARLIELHNAIRPPADEPARTTPNNEPPPVAS